MDLQSRRNLICGQSNNNNCVKDKDNLLDSNIWSGTDYLKNTNGFLHHPDITIESSTEWSNNGERSLKVNGNDWVRHTPIDDADGTYTASLNVYSEYNIRVVFYNTSSNLAVLNIPPNTTETSTISLTCTDTFYLNIFPYPRPTNDVSYYLDNITICKR